MRDFNEWLKGFRKSIATYGYYIDFEKVYKNANSVKIELNILNSLIGSQNIEQEFEDLTKRYPEVLKCIPILLAVRASKIYATDEEGEFLYDFETINLPIEQYKIFMRKTGLFELMEKHLINNLMDYVTGVETGLDSNGRKNRGGHLMEDLVERYIVAAGFKKDVDYFKEMYINQITEKWNVDLSSVSNNGKAEKRFDFVIKTENNLFLIETNFYASNGSKLNETARSYKQLTQEIAPIPYVSFVWFTDGNGWVSARKNLEETFEILEHLYNIKDLEDGILKKIMK
jgi:type II restriction enzyme